MLTRILALLLLFMLNPPSAGAQVYQPGLPPVGRVDALVAEAPEGVRVESIKASPTESGALQPGDVILAVDGQALRGLPFSDRLTALLGPADEPVDLLIERNGSQQSVTVRRKAPTPESVQAICEYVRKRWPSDWPVQGTVERVQGNEAGIQLCLPVARLVDPGKPIVLTRSRAVLGNATFIRVYDDSRLVVRLTDPREAVRPGDHALGSALSQGAPVIQPFEVAAPEPARPVRPTSARRLSVPPTLLHSHRDFVLALYRQMLRKLPDRVRARGSQVRLNIVSDPEINAVATFDEDGGRVIRLNQGLCETILVLSYHVASAESFDLKKALSDIQFMAFLRGLGEPRIPLPKEFVERMQSAPFRRRVEEIAAVMYVLVIGHELGHHCLGHLAHAPAAGLSLAELQELGRLAVTREHELEADVFGADAVTACKLEPRYAVVFALFMAEVEQGQSGLVPSYLKDHPDWKLRVEALQARFGLH